MTREFDLVLFGATGFTGRLVAEYLKKHLSGTRLALAGRDRAKLEALRTSLGMGGEGGVPILIGDARDEASLRAIAERAKVVCTTVGPYAKYGSPLVSACAEVGTDYCDLTGETQWIRRMIDAHQDDARSSGARIVHCCGFDSVPSDIGVWMMQEEAKKRHGAPCASIVFALRKARGGTSGGTIASAIGVMEEARRDKAVRKILLDPYALNPDGERSGPDGLGLRSVAYNEDLHGWTAPFVMAAINTRIVRRSNALSGFSYGRQFAYDEVMSFPKGPRGLAMATAVTAGLAGAFAALTFEPTRKLAERFVPAPGEGPSEEVRTSGSFDVVLHGKGKDEKGHPFALHGTVRGKGDPGYAATAVMLSEAALCLAHDGRSTPGGILTPAYAMGAPLLKRLRNAGMVFEVE